MGFGNEFREFSPLNTSPDSMYIVYPLVKTTAVLLRDEFLKGKSVEREREREQGEHPRLTTLPQDGNCDKLTCNMRVDEQTRSCKHARRPRPASYVDTS